MRRSSAYDARPSRVEGRGLCGLGRRHKNNSPNSMSHCIVMFMMAMLLLLLQLYLLLLLAATAASGASGFVGGSGARVSHVGLIHTACRYSQSLLSNLLQWRCRHGRLCTCTITTVLHDSSYANLVHGPG